MCLLVTSFVLTRCCVLTWAKKMLTRAILTVHASRLWPADRRFSTPDQDWYPHDHKHFATNYNVSALYVIPKTLHCQDCWVMNLLKWPMVSDTLSMCAFKKKVSYKKFHVATFFAPEIVDDCFQIRISKNLMLHATSLLLNVYFWLPGEH